MAYYYKYNFVSPEPLYALVQSELESYFATGAVDDLLFPKWTEKCLKKLGRSSYKINEAILFVDGYQAKLPPDFIAVREARACTEYAHPSIRKPGAFYKQIITRLDDPRQYDNCLPCDTCPTDVVVTYKVNEEYTPYSTKVAHLLQPGNISVLKNCSVDCLNLGVQSNDIFDIRDGKFITNFSSGDVHVVYYSEEVDDNGYQLIPDNEFIQEYIEMFLKYKVFEKLSNSIVDETFNQIQSKKQEYELKAQEAYVRAKIENRLETKEQVVRAIKRTNRRNDRFKIR